MNQAEIESWALSDGWAKQTDGTLEKTCDLAGHPVKVRLVLKERAVRSEVWRPKDGWKLLISTGYGGVHLDEWSKTLRGLGLWTILKQGAQPILEQSAPRF
jgi:hypothetical protein